MTALHYIWIVLLAGAALLCLASSRESLRGAGTGLETGIWAGGAMLFAALALARLLDLEDRSRRLLRATVHDEGGYAGRWDFQAPLATAVVVLGGLGLLGLWLAWEKGWLRKIPRTVLLAAVGMVALAGLVLLRIVSLHGVDRILFGGGLHLNWFLEVGLTGGVAACAVRYLRRPIQARRGSPKAL